MRRYARGGQLSVIKTPFCWSILGYQNQEYNILGKKPDALSAGAMSQQPRYGCRDDYDMELIELSG
jgi:hypothetical protein